jgi:hypothetical protein
MSQSQHLKVDDIWINYIINYIGIGNIWVVAQFGFRARPEKREIPLSA